MVSFHRRQLWFILLWPWLIFPPARICSQCMGYIELRKQSDVDNFPYFYPGCTEFTGEIIITAQQLSNVDSLIQLKAIHGDLIVDLFSSNSFVSYSGLDSLALIDGNLKIVAGGETPNPLRPVQDNPRPEAKGKRMPPDPGFDGLHHVETVTGDVSLYALNFIDRISLLEHVRQIRGDVRFELLNLVDTLRGFNQLDSIEGDLFIKHVLHSPYMDVFDKLCVIGGEFIVEASDFLDLSWVDSVKSIDGNFTLSNVTKMTGGDTLGMLHHLGGNLLVKDCKKLVSLPVFPILQEIPGSITLIGNDSLKTLQGLSATESIGGSLHLERNGITTCSHFANLMSIGGGLTILENGSLENLDGLGVFSTLANDLDIRGNASLQNIEGLSLSSISGNITIEENASLLHLRGLELITQIPSNVSIVNNASLASLDGLQNLDTIGHELRIEGNASLSTLQDLSALMYIGNEFSIRFNQSLVSLNTHLTYIDSTVSITNNTALSSLSFFNGPVLNGDLQIEFNPSLVDLTGMETLTRAKGDVIIRHNIGLQTLQGLDQLHLVGGYVDISDTRHLHNLDHLAALDSILGSLVLVLNDSLADLHGLQHLAMIGENLVLAENDILTSLAGLEQLRPEDLDFVNILQNESLSDCAIESLCQYLNAGGEAQIATNATGCNTIEEVTDACLVGTAGLYKAVYGLSPNPATQFVQVNGGSEYPAGIYLMDLMGRRYPVSHVGGVFDVSHLPAGQYGLLIQNTFESQWLRFIKL